MIILRKSGPVTVAVVVSRSTSNSRYPLNRETLQSGGRVSVSKETTVVSLTRDIDARDYKNTITNALFMHTSAAMYLRHRDNSTYLDNAVKVSCGPTGTPSNLRFY